MDVITISIIVNAFVIIQTVVERNRLPMQMIKPIGEEVSIAMGVNFWQPWMTDTRDRMIPFCAIYDCNREGFSSSRHRQK